MQPIALMSASYFEKKFDLYSLPLHLKGNDWNPNDRNTQKPRLVKVLAYTL